MLSSVNSRAAGCRNPLVFKGAGSSSMRNPLHRHYGRGDLHFVTFSGYRRRIPPRLASHDLSEYYQPGVNYFRLSKNFEYTSTPSPSSSSKISCNSNNLTNFQETCSL